MNSSKPRYKHILRFWLIRLRCQPETPSRAAAERKHYPVLVKCWRLCRDYKQPRLMRVVDNPKMPVPIRTDSRQDIQGSQAQEGHGFSAVCFASSELSQALIWQLSVCAVSSACLGICLLLTHLFFSRFLVPLNLK